MPFIAAPLLLAWSPLFVIFWWTNPPLYAALLPAALALLAL